MLWVYAWLFASLALGTWMFALHEIRQRPKSPKPSDDIAMATATLLAAFFPGVFLAVLLAWLQSCADQRQAAISRDAGRCPQCLKETIH